MEANKKSTMGQGQCKPKKDFARQRTKEDLGRKQTHKSSRHGATTSMGEMGIHNQKKIHVNDFILYRPIWSIADQHILQRDLDSLQSLVDRWLMDFKVFK